MQEKQRVFRLRSSRGLAMSMVLALAACAGQALAAAEASAVMQRLDVDKDGFLTVGEAEHGGIAMETFKAGDKDGNGLLDADELAAIAETTGDAMAR